MNCENCQLELEDFVYGELKPSRASEVRSHLADCAACRQHRLEIEGENEVFASYHARTALEPSPELWAAIRDRISAESEAAAAPKVSWLRALLGGSGFAALAASALRPVFLRQAAAALALIIVTVVATTLFLSRGEKRVDQVATRVDPSPTVAAPRSTPSTSSTPAATVDLPEARSTGEARLVAASAKPKARVLTEEQLLQQQVARTEREYVNTIRMLDRAIAKRKESLDPEVYSQYESSLALIDESIDKSRTALRGRVSDPVAGQFLLAAYARKVELMQEVALR